MKNFVKYPQLSTLDHRGITAKLLGQVTNFTAEKYVYHMEQNEKPFVAKGNLKSKGSIQWIPTQNVRMSLQAVIHFKAFAD